MIAVHFPMLAMNRSGGVRIVIALANGLADRGVRVRFIVPSYACEPPIPLRDNVKLEVVTPSRGSRIDYMRRLVAEIHRCEGLVVSTGYLTPSLIFAASPPGARMYSLIQGVETQSHIRLGRRPAWVKPGLAALARLGYRMDGYKIAVSNFVADAIGRRFVDEVINPGIRREFIDRIPPDRAARPRHERLTVGVLPVGGGTKGAPYAIGALESTRATGDPVDAVVYDLDYAADHFPSFVTRYSRVTPSGPDRSIAGFYTHCDVFVLTSLYEGFPLPPLEAMACGAAVVITDCGGMRDYAADGENALVVPTADADAVADAIRRLETDEPLRRRIVLGGYETAARFPEDRFVERCVQSVMSQLRAPC